MSKIFSIYISKESKHKIIEIFGLKFKFRILESFSEENLLINVKSVGKHTYGIKNCKFGSCGCTIGSFCSFGEDSKIGVSQHNLTGISSHPFCFEKQYGHFVDVDDVEYYKKINQPIEIGNDVWIGSNCIIMPGIKIPNGVIIGAGAVVTKSPPPYTIIAGVPARVIKYRYTPEEIEILERTKWWNWDDEKIKANINLFKNKKLFFQKFNIMNDKKIEQKMPTVSVIIPIYNAQNYIGRCLDSLINQTFKDIEIICVDDCSPDSSMEIVKEYANKDSRIKVIKNEKNLRYGKTREKGFLASKGEYVAFFDQDDTCDSDYLEKLYNKAIETNADAVKANVKYIFTDGSSSVVKTNEHIKYYKKHNKSLILVGQNAPWSFLLKRDFLTSNKIIPDEIDEGMCIGERIMYYSKNMQLVDDSFYNYHYGQDTAFSGNNNLTSYNIRTDIILKKIKMINSFDVDYDTYITFVKKHIQAVYTGIKRIHSYYEYDLLKKYIEDFISIFENLKLNEDQKQSEIYNYFYKELIDCIKNKNPDILIKYLTNRNKKEKTLETLSKLFFIKPFWKKFQQQLQLEENIFRVEDFFKEF